MSPVLTSLKLLFSTIFDIRVGINIGNANSTQTLGCNVLSKRKRSFQNDVYLVMPLDCEKEEYDRYEEVFMPYDL